MTSGKWTESRSLNSPRRATRRRQDIEPKRLTSTSQLRTSDESWPRRFGSRWRSRPNAWHPRHAGLVPRPLRHPLSVGGNPLLSRKSASIAISPLSIKGKCCAIAGQVGDSGPNDPGCRGSDSAQRRQSGSCHRNDETMSLALHHSIRSERGFDGRAMERGLRFTGGRQSCRRRRFPDCAQLATRGLNRLQARGHSLFVVNPDFASRPLEPRATLANVGVPARPPGRQGLRRSAPRKSHQQDTGPPACKKRPRIWHSNAPA
jgi:hypothetical protein